MTKAKLILAVAVLLAGYGGLLAFKARSTVTVFTTQIRNALPGTANTFFDANTTIIGQGIGRYYTFFPNSAAVNYAFLTDVGA